MDDLVHSWKPEVIADSSGQWTGNGLRFATAEEALSYAEDLMMRWLAVREIRTTLCEDPVNYRWINGKLERVEAPSGS